MTLGKNLSIIGLNAFSNCNKLKNIYVSKENEYFSSQNGILYNKEGTEIVIYPPGRRDREFIIPDGVTSIGRGCFSTNKYLRRIIVPNSVSRIGESAFSECSINSISLPDALEVIENNTFSYCSELTDIEIPESVKEIKDEAFFHCQKLERANLPSSLLSNGERAFGCCINLRSITIPLSLNHLGKDAYVGCPFLSLKIETK